MKKITRLLGLTDVEGKPFYGGIGAWVAGAVFIIGGIRTDEPLAIVSGVAFIAAFLVFSVGFYIKDGR